jgi:hypothetical protein
MSVQHVISMEGKKHKIAGINYLMNRIYTYPTTNEAKTKELNIIQDTLHNNEYNRNLSISHSKNHKHNKNTSPQHQTKKLAMFTYYRKEKKKSQNFTKKQIL